jgi:hypothetical protein
VIECGVCHQSFADKVNKSACPCMCHKRLPDNVNNGSGGWKWDFRTASLVPVKSEGEKFVEDIAEMATEAYGFPVVVEEVRA